MQPSCQCVKHVPWTPGEAGQVGAHLHKGWPAAGLWYSTVGCLPTVAVLKPTLRLIIQIAVIIRACRRLTEESLPKGLQL